jgi:hypothetical protein
LGGSHTPDPLAVKLKSTPPVWGDIALVPALERFEFQAQIRGCFGSGLMARKKIQVNPREPWRKAEDNDGHVITSVIIESL